jgi:short subunit dehydrogenase-like uncharacterized protein
MESLGEALLDFQSLSDLVSWLERWPQRTFRLSDHDAVAERGDPGNRATVKFVCESVLCLALNEGDLPKRGGILTPSTGLGEALAQRLRRAGMEVAVKV